MRAARVHAWGALPILDDIAEPSPGSGESLVAVDAAPVGHFDLTVARGEFDPRPRLPYVPGTDGAGTVIASESHALGSRVRIAGGGVGLRRQGTWAERVAVPDDALESVATDLDPAVVASFSVPASAAFSALHHLGALRAGQQVAVTGAAGAVGSIAVQLARLAGASFVFGSVSRASKAVAVPAGTTVIVGRGRELVAHLHEHTDGVDLLVDTVGGADLGDLVGAISPGGRLVLVGYTAGRSVTFDLPTLMDRDIAVLPLNLFRRPARTREAAATVLRLLANGDVQLPMTRFSLEDLPAAVSGLANGETVGRVVVVPASAGTDA